MPTITPMGWRIFHLRLCDSLILNSVAADILAPSFTRNF